jgi:hypothetical protein
MSADAEKQKLVAVDGYEASQKLKTCATKSSTLYGTTWDIRPFCWGKKHIVMIRIGQPIALFSPQLRLLQNTATE